MFYVMSNNDCNAFQTILNSSCRADISLTLHGKVSVFGVILVHIFQHSD